MIKNFTPPLSALFLIQKVFAARLVFQYLLSLHGITGFSILARFSDIFADTLKSGLAVRTITHVLYNNPIINSWPKIFKDYLLHNNYLTDELSIYHATPTMYLQLIMVAKGITTLGPYSTLIILFSLFMLITLFLFKYTFTFAPLIAKYFPYTYIAFITSFPTIFMLNRANYHSGFASIFIIAYLSLAFFNKNTNLRLFFLALASNYRPNLLILALMEIPLQPSMLSLIWRYFILGVYGIIIITTSYFISNSIDQNYSITSFFYGLDLYRSVYIYGQGGIEWGASLFGYIRMYDVFSGSASINLRILLNIISLLGLGLIATISYLSYKDRIRKVALVFLLCACTTLLTPVYGQYHTLIFFSPFILSWSSIYTNNASLRLNWVLYPTLILIIASFLLQTTNYTAVFLYSFFCCSIPFSIFHLFKKNKLVAPIEGLIFFTSLVAISPLGDEFSNGLCLPLILLTSTIIILSQEIQSLIQKHTSSVLVN